LKIENRYIEDDKNSVNRIAHNIKGMALNFSAGNIANLASKIELLAKEGNLQETLIF
jgi:HPt (histidine-containing phosphotransfer) domain-containing protein